MVAPLLGTYMIKAKPKVDSAGEINPYQSRFYVEFRKVLCFFLSHRRLVLVGTVVLFVLSLVMILTGSFRFITEYTGTASKAILEIGSPNPYTNDCSTIRPSAMPFALSNPFFMSQSPCPGKCQSSRCSMPFSPAAGLASSIPISSIAAMTMAMPVIFIRFDSS